MQDRYVDLCRQGFMKIGRATPRPRIKPRPIVACDKCRDWHPDGQHRKGGS